MPKGTSADQRPIGQPGSVEGDNQATDSGDELLIILTGEEKKKHEIRKNGDYERVDVDDTVGQGQRANHVAVSCETLERLVQGFGVDVTKGYTATNRDP